MRLALEGALIAAVLTPVAMHAGLRRALYPMRVPLLAMVALALLGQLALSTRAFPFTDWRMYSSLPHGDPSVYEYDAELRDGRRMPLVPGRYLGPESADRLMEALRRNHDPAALRALAKLSGEPVAAVLVSERTISIRTGRKGPAHVVQRVEMP